MPFQVAMLAAGAAGYPLLRFVTAATLARGIRYFGLAALVKAFGGHAEELWKEHRLLAALAVFGVVAALFGLTQLIGEWVLGG